MIDTGPDLLGFNGRSQDRESGAEGIRTPDPLTASQMRYQLRHSPLPGQRYTTPSAGRQAGLSR
jgi:hypothetical protein